MDWHRIVSFEFWWQNHPTDWKYDKFINELIDNHGIVRVDDYYAKAGDLLIWVENWPYCYGRPEGNDYARVLPSVKTRKRIRDMLHQKKHRWIK